jgi:hypothetical protein
MKHKDKKNINLNKNKSDFNTICEECRNKSETVLHNLILTGFKICSSCKTSKTIFPF